MRKNILLSSLVFIICLFLWFSYEHQTRVLAQTSVPSPDSEVSVVEANGYGSTGIYARTFSSVIENVGQDITYTSDSVNGDYFTINNDGLYAISYSDGTPNSDNVGVSLNLSGASRWSTSWGTGEELCFFGIGNNADGCAVTVLLSRNDVVRASWDAGSGHGTNVQTIARFIIVRVR